MIDRFTGKYAFLSNFLRQPVTVWGRTFRSAEHAFQWKKGEGSDPQGQKQVLEAETPAEAKRCGKRLHMRRDWDRVKIGVMDEVLAAKFQHGSDLAKRLLATGTEELVEGNHWGDEFWGVDDKTRRGQNQLGKALMRRRAALRELEEERKINIRGGTVGAINQGDHATVTVRQR